MNLQANIPLIEQIAAEIRAALGDDFDDDTFLDTLDGETDAVEIIDRLIDRSQEAAAMALATKFRMDDLTARKNRLEATSSACRLGILRILQAIGQRKIERPLGTASISKGRQVVLIRDEASIPTQLCKITRTPDKAAIKAQLDAGETVPGAEIETRPETLTLRSK